MFIPKKCVTLQAKFIKKMMRQLKITKSITNRESASLDKYLQEIGREPLISVEEEVQLAQRIFPLQNIVFIICLQ